jgi:hypothetical protein
MGDKHTLVPQCEGKRVLADAQHHIGYQIYSDARRLPSHCRKAQQIVERDRARGCRHSASRAQPT